MSEIRSYRDLDAWKKGMKVAEVCYALTELFPPREVYGLANQIHRAAVSIPSNIAEGHSRRSRQAYLNHLSIALGSQAELETQIELSQRLGFISNKDSTDALAQIHEVGRLLNGLIRAIERPLPSP
jgi:four helix bundle protein